MKKELLALALIAALASLTAAGCAVDAYARACSSCPFDENGTMDKTCYDAFIASGKACISAAYPSASGAYLVGECPQIDACVSQMTECKTRSGSGSDKRDCEGALVKKCFAYADECVESAALQCAEKEESCLPILMLASVMVFVFVSSREAK